MKFNLKLMGVGKIAISMLMFAMLVLSSVSNSHTAMHNHDVAKSAASAELKMQHSDFHDAHSKHHKAAQFADQENGSTEVSYTSADMCCSSICMTAIVLNDFAGHGPRLSQCEIDWRSSPLLAGELASLHRPPNT